MNDIVEAPPPSPFSWEFEKKVLPEMPLLRLITDIHFTSNRFRLVDRRDWNHFFSKELIKLTIETIFNEA